ncbi:MAG TPA: hypothetical protein PLX97_13925, partial [Gemmatales bacterium]|nr:hypothetical protein [Gemmatales bacterium]
RIAANGDVANKIGTYSVAVLARAHNIPFYVAAPYSTIDLKTKTGDDIPIEQRNPSEVTTIHGSHPVAPKDVAVYNPAFDVTPAELITGIITERGVFKPQEIKSHFLADYGCGSEHAIILAAHGFYSFLHTVSHNPWLVVPASTGTHSSPLACLPVLITSPVPICP